MERGRRTRIGYGNGRATRYEYDPVSRLEELVERSATGFDVLTTTFAYNPASQIRTRTREPREFGPLPN